MTEGINTTASSVKNSGGKTFTQEINKRINDYFKSNNISRYANTEMVIKTIFMFSLYLVPFFIMLSGTVSYPMVLLLYVVMGFGISGIGLSVMHDANHGSYSRKKWINKILGYSLNILGGNATNWIIQHNVLHHTYTNIDGLDEDISPRGIMRFSPHTERKSIHKYQHIYAWFLYSLMTISWVLMKDIMQLQRYSKGGLLKKQNISEFRAWSWLIFSKIAYLGYTVALPVILTPLLLWQAILGLLIMHFISGFVLAIIFQPAHVNESAEFPLLNSKGEVVDQWADHQMKTTMNFAQRNKILSWYVGGLNYQIEHHLFPNICHVHYRKLSKIVKETAKEYGLPYLEKTTFTEAVIDHARLLKKLGKPTIA